MDGSVIAPALPQPGVPQPGAPQPDAPQLNTLQPGAPFDLDAFAAAHEARDQLRLITCGSVDDGKSTLLGRLLWETKAVADDQVTALATASRRHGTQGEAMDLALLVDGLAAEREQGITIDVAYRFFSTQQRRFVVADTPGHEQYTRNMATGASTADLAILLVDARSGLTAQTRRHALVASMLRVRHVVIAINKMDLVGWSEAAAAEIGEAARALCDGLGFDTVATVPLSALSGDNVVARGASCPWYRGPTLLEHLEAVPVLPAAATPFRLAVQWVNRPDATLRGLSGEVSGGAIRVGDAVRILPAGQDAAVARILSASGGGVSGEVASALPGEAVTVVLDRAVDVSRGDVLCEPARPARVSRALSARLLWFDAAPSRPGMRLLLKLGTRSVAARLGDIGGRVLLDTMGTEAAEALAQNDVGDATLLLDRPLAHDLYEESRAFGGFVLIDPETFDTVALGLVRAPVASADRAADSTLRSLAKTVSYRAFASVVTGGIAWALTGNIGAAVAIGGLDVVGKLVLYFVHERVWAVVPFGRERRA